MTQRLFLNKDLEASHVETSRSGETRAFCHQWREGRTAGGLSLCGTCTVIGKFK